jgi:uncharacterized protein
MAICYSPSGGIMSEIPFLSVKPGSSVNGYIRLELDAPFDIPYTIVKGEKPGPMLVVTAGIHGAEYASIAAAVNIARMNPSEIAGTLVVLPIVCMPAYHARSIYTNPVDGKNLNRQFPGDFEGTFSQQLAAWITENAIQPANAYIDLHGGDMIEALEPFTIYPEHHAESLALAQAFGIPLLVAAAPGGTTTSAAQASNIPSILAEAGGNGLWSKEDVSMLENGVRRAMQHLGMLEGNPEAVACTELTQFAWLRSEVAGLWYPKVRLGKLEKGQDLGVITDYFGKILQPVVSPIDGIVLFSVTSLAIGLDDPLYGIGA